MGPENRFVDSAFIICPREKFKDIIRNNTGCLVLLYCHFKPKL